MQDELNPIARLPASIVIANVTFDKAEAARLNGRYVTFDLLEILTVTCGEIVRTDYLLVELQQSLQKIAADEAGGPCYQPLSRGVDKIPGSCDSALQPPHSKSRLPDGSSIKSGFDVDKDPVRF